MKKMHFKTKLVLNSQTIRRLKPEDLRDMQGGMPRIVSDLCSAQCGGPGRGCA
jgi:hypothetical protein